MVFGLMLLVFYRLAVRLGETFLHRSVRLVSVPVAFLIALCLLTLFGVVRIILICSGILPPV